MTKHELPNFLSYKLGWDLTWFVKSYIFSSQQFKKYNKKILLVLYNFYYHLLILKLWPLLLFVVGSLIKIYTITS